MSTRDCETIILLTDAPSGLAKFAALFERAGYKVIKAQSLNETFELLKTQSPSLLVSAASFKKEQKLYSILQSELDLREIPNLLVFDSNSEFTESISEAGCNYIKSSDDPLLLISKVSRLIERNRAETKIKRSQARFNHLFESDMIGMVFWKKSGQIADANEYFLRMLGYTKEDLKSGKINWIELTPKEHLFKDENALAEIAVKGFCQPFEKEYFRRNGSRVPVLLGGSVFKDDEENGVSFVMNIEDRKRAEAENIKLASIVESSDDAIISKDFKGNILSWNKGAERMLGYTAQEMIGRNVTTLFPPDLLAEETVILSKIKRSEHIQHYETRRRRKDGSDVEISLTISPIKNENGEVVGASKIARDITEQKRAEERLRISKERLDIAQQSARIGSFEWNIEDNISIWSDELENLFGLPPGQFDGTRDSWAKCVHPDDLVIAEEKLELALESGELVNEYRIILPDGKIRWLHVRAKVFYDANEKPQRLVGINMDITEIKQVDEDLKASREQLRALNSHLQNIQERERTQIAREIHDSLGQSLTTLKIDISWLKKRVLNLRQNDVTQKISERVEDMLLTTNETIKAVQNISAELRPGVLDSLGLTAALEWQAGEFEKRTEITCFCDELTETPGDINQEKSTAVFRIFQEILTNIVRHANATRVWVKLQSDDKELRLIVRDNGKGIINQKVTDVNSLGILGMRERALLWEGDVNFKRPSGGGTEVTVRIPL